MKLFLYLLAMLTGLSGADAARAAVPVAQWSSASVIAQVVAEKARVQAVAPGLAPVRLHHARLIRAQAEPFVTLAVIRPVPFPSKGERTRE